MSYFPEDIPFMSEEEVRKNGIRNVGDTISRQTAIDAFKTDGSVFAYGQNTCKAIVSRLKMIPSAERTGHWIDTNNYYQRWKCSECGCHTRDARPNYCSNCGAHMINGTGD